MPLFRARCASLTCCSRPVAASTLEVREAAGPRCTLLAFYYGHLPSARILLNKKARLEATDSNGMTPAHCAVDANQLEIVKFALEAGANAEARDICGWTLLMRAVVMDASMELIKVLVTHGADLAAVDGVGKTCADLAKLYHRQEAKDYFDEVQKFRLQKSVATADAVTKAQLQ
ncbi:uncharacterized protein Dsimw501_GD19692, isoform B [Drosophila simulans]|nr:uncharacterized protein Dsimw501_GD19692, isoform B [Drosophila simulans]